MSVGAMVLLYTLVPTPTQQVRSRDARAFVHQLKDVVMDKQLLRLSYGIFALHAVLVGTFVAIPVALLEAGMAQVDHWQVYLPVMLIAFICMVPFIIIAEKRKKMKEVLMLAVALLMVGTAWMAFSLNSLSGLIGALWLFFLAFNILEASLPSLISKFAPAGYKGSAMGLYSTSQFLGAFVGGLLGGYMSEHVSLAGVFWGLIPLLLIWFGLVITMNRPKHLTSYMVNLNNQTMDSSHDLEDKLLALPGVDEVVIMLKEQAAYLKVDNKTFDPTKLKQINI